MSRKEYKVQLLEYGTHWKEADQEPTKILWELYCQRNMDLA